MAELNKFILSMGDHVKKAILDDYAWSSKNHY